MCEGIQTTVCLIRHGETDWNATGRLQGCEDIEMNDNGRRQAYEAAAYLSRTSWDMIYSSPLKRAMETAKIIAGNVGLASIQIHEDLKERNYGAASGLLPQERKALFPDGIIPGQESFDSLKNRALQTLNEIAIGHTGKKILIVSHGAFTNSILYALSNGEFGSFKTRLKNGCINLLTMEAEKWEVKYYNKTPGELIP